MSKIGSDAPPPRRTTRHLILQPECLEDLQHWVKSDSRMAMGLLRLMEEILRDPVALTEKPEPVKGLGPNV